MLRCFVRGRIFGTFANLSAPVLSSKSQQCMLVLVLPILIPILAASFMRWVMGITSHNACDRAMYSASVELRAISVWSFDAQMRGHPAYRIMYPLHDLAIVALMSAFVLAHSLACDASAQHSNGDFVGDRIKPSSDVPRRYLPICFTTSPCDFFGAAQNLAHWWTA